MQNFSTRMQQLLVLSAVLFYSQILNAQLVNPRGSQVSLTTAETTISVAAIDATFGVTRSLYCGDMTEGESALSVTPAEACEAIADDLTGKIAFLDRGNCNFDEKVLSAQTAGAVAVVICNNSNEALFALRPVDVGDQVSIPSYFVSQGDCAALRAAGDGMVAIMGMPPAFDPRDNVIWGAAGEGSFTGEIGDWTAVDYLACPNAPDGFSLWQWVEDGTAYTGAYAGTNAGINSPTACSGTMVFNSDFYDNAGTAGNFGNGDCAANQLGALISPSIDLSAVPAEAGLAVKFTQGIRQFQSGHFVGWSIDGGLTWDSLQVNTDLEVNSDHVSRTERVQLPQEVNGQSDVRIKFTMNGNYYYWIVDDVQIIERESFNLAVDQFFAIPPNSITPASQITPFGFLADVRNRGAANQDDVVLNLSIFNEAAEEIFTTSLDYGTIESDSVIENRAFAGQFTPPAEVGVYTGIYEITSGNEDFDSSDNRQSFFFAISDTTFAKELGQGFTSVAPNFETTPTWSYGNYFYVPNGEGYEITSITFGIGNPEEAAGISVVGTLSKWSDANGDGVSQSEEREFVDFVEYEITGDEPVNGPIVISFTEAPALENDTEYVLMMNYNGAVRATATDDLALQYLATGLLADSLATGRGEYATLFGNTDDFIGVELFPSGNFTALVRMHINTIGVNTEEVLAAENKVTLYPNPTTSELNVSFDLLENAEKVTLRVTDATGRVVSQSPFQNVRRNTFTFDVSNLANGVYYMDIITEAGHRTERFVVTK